MQGVVLVCCTKSEGFYFIFNESRQHGQKQGKTVELEVELLVCRARSGGCNSELLVVVTVAGLASRFVEVD